MKMGTIWYSTTGAGKIGHIDPQTNELTQISTETILQAPRSFMFFDDNGNLWDCRTYRLSNYPDLIQF